MIVPAGYGLLGINVRAFPAGCGELHVNMRVERMGGDNLYMRNGFSRYYYVQIVVENAENSFDADNTYKEKGLQIMINVQIVQPSTGGRG